MGMLKTNQCTHFYGEIIIIQKASANGRFKTWAYLGKFLRVQNPKTYALQLIKT